MPNRNPDTGNWTKAGFIPKIQAFTKYSTTLLVGFQNIQGKISVVLEQDMLITTWFPFDASVSPVYETVNTMQVIFSS